MKLPFDSIEFFHVFGTYNAAVWPLQMVLYLLSFLVLFLYFNRRPNSLKMAFYLLSMLWFVNGVGYHLSYFSAINKAAYLFGALFLVQAFLFARYAWKSPGTPEEIHPVRGGMSAILILYALVFYSLIGYLAGHEYPRAPIFGVAPCPTTIFTFGLLLAVERLRWYMVLIPLLWALIGTSAAFVLGVREDLGLTVAALVFVGARFSRRLYPSG